MTVFQRFKTTTIVFQAGEHAALQPWRSRAGRRAAPLPAWKTTLVVSYIWKTIIFIFFIIKTSAQMNFSFGGMNFLIHFFRILMWVEDAFCCSFKVEDCVFYTCNYLINLYRKFYVWRYKFFKLIFCCNCNPPATPRCTTEMEDAHDTVLYYMHN